MSRHTFVAHFRAVIFLSALVGQLNEASSQGSWEQAKVDRSATLDLYWYTSVPFIYRDADGNMAGIENDMLQEFVRYVKLEYGVALELNWIEAGSFTNVIDRLKSIPYSDNSIGVSAFSITGERKQVLNFTDPYFPDVTVLVSSNGSPIVDSYDAIHQMMDNMTAVTIESTTYESFLLELKKEFNSEMDLLYIDSDENILDYISEAPNRFGFIDLPIYLMLIKRGGELVRQNFFTKRGTGYGLALPAQSDWAIPFNEFLDNSTESQLLSTIIGSYLGDELYSFMENVNSEEQLSTSILTKEKELQLELTKNANLKLEEEQAFKKVLILSIIITGLFLGVIGILFFNNSRKTRILSNQKNQIEEHQAAIKEKNEQLLNRNRRLMTLVEEKNHLVRILAHDLRSPLQQIIGFVDLVKRSDSKLSEDDDERLEYINYASFQMNTMISRILNSELIEADKNEPILEMVNISSIMLELFNRYHQQSEDKGIKLFLDNCSQDCSIYTDRLLLHLILENLLSNSLKFSKSGTCINISADCAVEEVVFMIKDEGPGFTEDDKLLIFNRFQRLSARPTGGESSTGLGLSIVKRYVDDLGGNIRLESTKGAGSCFFVSIPKKS